MSAKVQSPASYPPPKAKEDPPKTRPEIIPPPVLSQPRPPPTQEPDAKPPSRPPSRSGSPPSKPPPATKPAPPHEDALPSQEEVPSEDSIDMEIFTQIIELGEDDEDFCREMVQTYFGQAGETFGKMDAALVARNLKELSSLGHFLKGSSAALGVSKVQASCEKIQHYGQLRDEEADKDMTEPQALEKITILLKDVKVEYGDAQKWLTDYLAEPTAVGSTGLKTVSKERPQ